jgi:DNA polymerase V
VALIAHLDADCFYVSAERVRDSFLCEKPVGVLGNQGACVIAKSYEMKRLGVKTGEPIWDAVKKCPEGLYIKRDFRWYEAVSREMLTAVRERSPCVEYYSIDEFFLSVDAADPEQFARAIQKEILQRIGVPVTIGIARTKTLAKLVSDTAKPFGALTLIGEDAERSLLASRPASDITGIAQRRAMTLAQHGIVTCLDFASAQPSLIRRLLTVVGEKLLYELRGERTMPIQTQRPPHKMISRGGSIGEPSPDPAVQWAWIVRNLERLVEALDYHGLMVGKLTLVLEYKDGPDRSSSVRFDAPTARFDVLLAGIKVLWDRMHFPGRLYRMHHIASELQYPGPRQLSLFDPPRRNDERIVGLMHRVNDRHGRFAVRSAATLPLQEIYADDAHSYDICDIHGKTCF